MSVVNSSGKKFKKPVKQPDLYGVNLRVELSVDDHLEFERFALDVKMQCLRDFKRKPAFGLQKLCSLLIELLLKDKEFKERIKQLVIEHYRSQKQV